MVLPRYNAKGLLCGETLLALSEDGSTILSESNRSKTKDYEGFYTIKAGDGKKLVIADRKTLSDAKALAKNLTTATIVFANPNRLNQLSEQLNAQGLIPAKVLVLGHSTDKNRQLYIAESAKAFHANGAVISLMDVDASKIIPLNLKELDKTRLKMSFEQLIAQKPLATAEETLTAAQHFTRLKKEHPILVTYEMHGKQLSQVKNTLTGLAREQLDQMLLDLANKIIGDKKLMATLLRDVPNVAKHIKNRLVANQRQGIKR